jgi:hypothetical protein
MGYFKEYPAPIYEETTRLSPASVINSTTPYYGPLLYWLARCTGAHHALEIGVAQFWTGGFIAHGVKDNNTRYGANGKYYGMDIQDKAEFKANADELQLPVEFIIHPAGSVDYLEKNVNQWPDGFFNFIYIDGYHNTEYVQREVELLYPKLAGNGAGYMIHHDIYSYCEELWGLVVKDPRYQWEHVRFLDNYGLGILRKMEGYDHSKVFWPEGDQHFTEFAT